MWNTSALFFDALNELGIPSSYDPNNGLIPGASFLPLDLDPSTQTRSTARRAYYDPVASRANLWISTGQFVTRILFDQAQASFGSSTTSSNGPSHGQGSSPGVPGGIYGSTTTVNVHGANRKRNVLGRLLSLIRHSTQRRQVNPNSPSPLRAIGVEYASDSHDPRRTVLASREVVIAAGAIHSPQVLMLSGIGPSTHLQQTGTPVNVDLPGVGSNLQDHGQVWTFYPYENSSYDLPTALSRDQAFLTDAWVDYWANRTGPFTTTSIDGVAFPSLPHIVNGSQALPDAAFLQAVSQYLPSTSAPEILAGYAQQLPLLVDALGNVTRASYEILNGNDGVLTVATMRPFSRGNIRLNSSAPFDPPLIDPRYGSNPVDVEVLLASLRFNERIVNTNSLAVLNPSQLSPAAGSTDEALRRYIRSHLQTEYHPGGTCAMMPRELGGVVDSNLLVYGTDNLRVVDSSIMPILPAAHLQAVVYGVAEKAADIIRAANRGITPETQHQPSPTIAYVTVVETQTVYI